MFLLKQIRKLLPNKNYPHFDTFHTKNNLQIASENNTKYRLLVSGTSGTSRYRVKYRVFTMLVSLIQQFIVTSLILGTATE